MTDLTTDEVNAMAIAIFRQNTTVDDYLATVEIAPSNQVEFRRMWASINLEVRTTVLPPGHSWDVPSEWP